MKNILFIIDAQNDFCSDGGSLVCENAKVAVDNICKLLDNNKFDDIICTMDTHDKYYPTTREGDKLAIKHCIEGTWGYELNKDIYVSLYGNRWKSLQKKQFMIPVDVLNEINVRYSAMYSEGGVTKENFKVYICGFATEICVLNNALAINSLSFLGHHNIRLIEPCCAGISQTTHKMAVDIMEANHIDIIKNLEEIKL